VGYKEIRNGALYDYNPDALVGLEFPAEFVEFLRQNFIKKIYRRMVDADECDSRIKPTPETFVIRIWQGSGSISAMIYVFPTLGLTRDMAIAAPACDAGSPRSVMYWHYSS
jgi:hypothetical protein